MTKHKVDHIVFPTAWFDVLPLFAAIGFHGSWARGMQVNFLSANSHVPEVLNTGSGLFTPTGVKKYYRSLSVNGSLSVATLPKSPKDRPSGAPVVNAQKMQEVNAGEDSFYSDLFGDLFLFKELKKPEGTLKVCYNGSSVCCSLTYEMAAKRTDEMYALGVFDGLHTLEGQYYLQICTLIKCLGLKRNSCGQRVYNASTIFKSFTLRGSLGTQYIFPQVVADDVSLLPGEWEHSVPVTHLQTKKQLTKGLLTAALFGRVYELDDGPRPTTHPSVESSAPQIYGHVFVVGILSVIVYLCFEKK